MANLIAMPRRLADFSSSIGSYNKSRHGDFKLLHGHIALAQLGT
jgi:hypothetical protein